MVTSATHALAVVRLRAAGFRIPKHLVTASDIQRGKPDPEPYLRGAQNLGLSAGRLHRDRRCPAGIQSGKAAGSRVIALRTTAEDPLCAQPAPTGSSHDCSAIAIATLPAMELC